MSWIGISNGRRVIKSPAVTELDQLVSVGTLMVEVPFAASQGVRQIILDLNPKLDWPRRVLISVDHGGDLVIESQQGTSTIRANIQVPPVDQGRNLRITMSWHGPERLGLLTVENLDTQEMAQGVFEKPLPWTTNDVSMLIDGAEGVWVNPDITLLAISDAVEPVGLTGGFGAGTLIDTINGPCPVEDLRPGDIVQTSEHGMQPIRRITSYEVPSAGRFVPLHLNAPFFGLERDLIVAQDHRLLVSGADAEYLFGADEVLIEAHYLSRMAAPVMRDRPATVRYVQVLLDAHVCLSVGGAWGESLYVGDLADDPKRLATSTLAHIPARELPRHGQIAGQQLKGYEAIVLVSTLCA